MKAVHKEKCLSRCFWIPLIFIIGLIVCATPANAAEDQTVIRKLYEFDKGTDYTFSEKAECRPTAQGSTYGLFSINGTADSLTSVTDKDGVPAFEVTDGNIEISYSYSDAMLNTGDEEWHVVEDKEKNLDAYKLDDNIAKGALILQRSIDGINWSNILIQANAFEQVPSQNNPIYETTDVELINGCYYWMIVAYELSRKIGSSKIIGLIPKDEYEYRRVAELPEAVK